MWSGRNVCAAAVATALLVGCWLAAAAAAAPPEFMARMTAGGGHPGSGAGEVDNPRGIAANPVTGHVYVSDLNNARIDEYTAWGAFVRAWGWDVAPDGAPGDTVADQLEQCGPSAPEETPPLSLCQKGTVGGGSGQVGSPFGITIDSAGAVYVYELANLRIQKFTADGEFLLMFGGGVNRTKVEDGAPAAQRNVCPVDPGDVCQAGTAGEEPSQLTGTVRNVIAYDRDADRIVVGDKDRIQIFDPEGAYLEEIAFEGQLAALAGKSVNALDVDAAGNIYFSVGGVEDVFKLSAAGVPLAPGKPGESKFDVETPLGIAVDHGGNVYVIDDPTEEFVEQRVVKFDPAGNRLVPTKAEEETKTFFPYVPFQGPALIGIETNICAGSPEPGNLYISAFKFGEVAYVDAYGSGPTGCESPPLRPPIIAAQYATSVGGEGAKVQAAINPKFWSDATYYVEYGEVPCSPGGCTAKTPPTPILLTDRSVNKVLKTAAIALTGLRPATTYYYRFVAQSSGGGPVFGEDRSFITSKVPRSADPCFNDAFRLGGGAQLPDCRAYEIVSPLDKAGGDAAPWIAKNALFPLFFELNQSAPSGDRFTFSSAYSFEDAESAPFVSQYLSERGPGGWGSDPISPPRSEGPLQVDNFENEFQLFSEDLCRAWLRHNSVAPLAAGAIPEFPNLYRRDNCAEPPTFAALSIEEPPDRDPDEYVRLLAQGASDDGTHAIFAANDELVKEAPTLAGEFEMLLYESAPEALRFVCVLPSGKANVTPCAAGTALASAQNAISADGSRIFWTAYSGSTGSGDQPGAPGQIYVRIDGTETRKVSTSVAPDPAWYWTASDDGSKVLFSFDSGPHKDRLYEFDVDTEAATLIAEGVEGPMGTSEDASRIYFASTEDLDGAGPGTKGAHNLYLYDANGAGGAGSFAFVMSLAADDVGGSNAAPAPIDEAPAQRGARVAPDGLHATFSAVAPPPSGYDNLEATTDEPAQEVYRYDATTNDLRCISCNPTGARPVAEEIGAGESYYAAAQVQGWEALGHAPRVISEDGSRVFFESFEALVPRDTNGTWDVYEWEEPGKGSCDKGDSTYGEESGGCVELISSGESPAKSTFLDADPSGDNIFFSTQSSLVGQDYGLNDVYVARVGGGFGEPQPKPICEGDACQGPSAAPVPPTPSSSTYRGPEALKRLCPKGKRRVKRAGKVRCVPRKRKGAKARKRGSGRRAAR